MCPTDEFGIEFDTDVETAIKDPKSTILMKVLDYREKRKSAEKAKADTEEAERLDKEKRKSIFPW